MFLPALLFLAAEMAVSMEWPAPRRLNRLEFLDPAPDDGIYKRLWRLALSSRSLGASRPVMRARRLRPRLMCCCKNFKARGTFVLAWQLLGVLVWATTHHLWVDIISGLMNPLEGEGDDAWVGASCWSSLYAGRKREEN